MAHILVVDDERSICELLEITFRKEGHRVEVAFDVENARRKMQSSIFDIVVSDIRMPDGTGVELLQFCKEISPSSYFLLITGVPTVETAIAAINSGAGVMDTCGFFKDQAYYYQANWTAKPMLHLFPHWNWTVARARDCGPRLFSS